MIQPWAMINRNSTGGSAGSVEVTSLFITMKQRARRTIGFLYILEFSFYNFPNAFRT